MVLMQYAIWPSITYAVCDLGLMPLMQYVIWSSVTDAVCDLVHYH